LTFENRGRTVTTDRKGGPTQARDPQFALPKIFDGEKEAKLIALPCSEPPKGRVRWTLRLLEEKVVELKIVDNASDNTIGRVLKKPSQTRHPGVKLRDAPTRW
jgi:hypothetical protein